MRWKGPSLTLPDESTINCKSSCCDCVHISPLRPRTPFKSKHVLSCIFVHFHSLPLDSLTQHVRASVYLSVFPRFSVVYRWLVHGSPNPGFPRPPTPREVMCYPASSYYILKWIMIDNIDFFSSNIRVGKKNDTINEYTLNNHIERIFLPESKERIVNAITHGFMIST